MATFWERATHSVNRVFSLYWLFVILVISHLSFDGKTLVLIATAPGHCSLLTFFTFYNFSSQTMVHASASASSASAVY